MSDEVQIDFERLAFALLAKGPVTFDIDEFIDLMNGKTEFKYLVIQPDEKQYTVTVEVTKTNDDA